MNIYYITKENKFRFFILYVVSTYIFVILFSSYILSLTMMNVHGVSEPVPSCAIHWRASKVRTHVSGHIG